ncbi:FHA domain-containing protein [Agrobacterium burrii]
MLSIRGLLLFAWLVLIASLLYDPFSAQWTRPDSAGPFGISSTPVMVQGQVLTNQPYSMGSRMFWTMIVPLLPLFLMVFGHEAWRRICPLSLASQIPSYLGLRRRRSSLERRTGLIKRTIPLIKRDGWLERNSWYVQFGLLFCGIIARLLLINTDRYALAIALLTVIGAAMLTGALWGGKTWCNFFCPANVVQKIYTEPGGILESSPHFSRPALPQSMCRKPSGKGDISACVACKANCGDIDLQRSYWSGVNAIPRRNVYYMFFGLIIGFYGFYYLYAGSWDYYFSGIWTHEEGIQAKLLQPGLFILGYLIPIPKLLSAPLVLGLACAASLVLGRGLEALYRKIRSREPGMTEQLIVHHCLCVSAWASINAFYLFGGRPNILLLPPLAGRVVDIAIVALTTIWLRQVLLQTPERYQQEGMASGLLKQLKTMKLDGSSFPDDRKFENLRPGEIYLLAKVLPNFSQQQKLDAYSKMLEEQIAKGTTGGETSHKLLEDFRKQLNITEEDHNNLLDALGYSDDANIQISLSTEEKAAVIAQYRSILEKTVTERLETRQTVVNILELESVKSMLTVMRQSLQISDSEHDAALAALFSGGIVSEEMKDSLEALIRHKSVRLRLERAEVYDPLGSSLTDVLLDYLEEREQVLFSNALSLLRNFLNTPETYRIADDLAALAGPRLKLMLRQPVPSNPDMRWRQVFPSDVLERLQQMRGQWESENAAHHRAVSGSRDIEQNLLEVLTLEDPTIRAIGLTVFSYMAPGLVASVARGLLEEADTRQHAMLYTVAKHIGGLETPSQSDNAAVTFHATVNTAGGSQILRLDKRLVTLGRAADNDISISDPAVWTYHAELKAEHGEVRLMRVDNAIIFVNGSQVHNEPVAVTRRSVIRFGNGEANAPSVVIDWDDEIETGDAVHIHPIHRLAILARHDKLRRLSPTELSTLALESRAVKYRRGDRLEARTGEQRFFLVHTGLVRLFDPAAMSFVPGVSYEAGDLFRFAPGAVDSPYFPETESDISVLLDVPARPEVEVCAVTLQLVEHSAQNGRVLHSEPTNEKI